MTDLYELNCRYPGASRAVRPLPDADAETRYALMRSSRCVIFVHGFANDEDEARRKYRLTMTQLREVFGEDDTAYFAFLWPGDHPRPGEDQLTFSVRVGLAAAAGQALALGLGTVYRPTGHVVLVAHSLGCRTVLQFLATLNAMLPETEAGARLSIVCVALMAGAVPVSECETTSPVYGHRYPDAWYQNFHSPRDKVLKLAFPGGQQLVDRLATAIGLHGDPHDNRWDTRLNTGFGHSDYWGAPLTAEAIALCAGAVETKGVTTWPTPQVEPPSATLRASHLRRERDRS